MRTRSGPPTNTARGYAPPQLDIAGRAVRQGRARLREVRDAQRDVLERATFTRTLGVEQRQLPAPRIRANERERVLPVDDVHAKVAGDEVHDRFSVRDP